MVLMAHIKSINSVSLGKVLGLMYMILSLVFSPFFFLIAAEATSISSAAVVLFIIVFYGAMGGIAGLLIGVIYNFIAGRFGGIELEIETN
jgi:hypothetical protein